MYNDHPCDHCHSRRYTHRLHLHRHLQKNIHLHHPSHLHRHCLQYIIETRITIFKNLLGRPPLRSLSSAHTPRTSCISSKNIGTLALSRLEPTANNETKRSRQIQRRIWSIFCGPRTERRFSTFPFLSLRAKLTGRFIKAHLQLWAVISAFIVGN